MARESNLQLYSFEVSAESIPNKQIYCFKMPSEMKEYLKKFKNLNNPGYNLKLGSLSKAIQSLFPEVVFCYSKPDIIENDNITWLYSMKNFDLRAIKRCARIWLETESEYRKMDIGEVIFKEEWEWSNQISSREVLELASEQFGIIPAIYAYDFCNNPPAFSTINRYIAFNVFYVDNKHVCISEYIDIRKKRFSFAIEFSLITHRDYPDQRLINVEISVKAWETSGLIKNGTCYLRSGEGKSVFFSLENPYFSFDKKRFVQLKITRKDATGCKWDDIGGRIFNEFLQNNEFNCSGFEIDQLISEPVKYMDGHQGITMYITSSLKDGKNFKMVQPGPGLPIRKELYHIITEKYEKLIPRPRIPEIKVQSLNKDLLCPYLPYNSEKVYFEVYTRETNLVKLAKDSLQDILKLYQVDENLYRTRQGSYIQVEVKDPSAITRLLDTTDDYENRVKLVEDNAVQYSDSDFPVMCLVDIPAYHEKLDNDESDDDVFERSKLDPKNAIRVGMRKAGRLSQFINSIEDGQCNSDKNKVRSCILDLLSDAGFQEGILKESGYENRIIIGVMSTGDPEVYALSKFLNGMPFIKFYGEEKWHRFPNSLLNVTGERVKKANIGYGNKRVAFEGWILAEIQKALNEHKDDIIYLFCDVSLRNGEWGFLKNNALDMSSLRLVGKERLRIIRVNEGSEIPDYFIDSGDKSDFEKSFEYFVSNVVNDRLCYKSSSKDGKFTISRINKHGSIFDSSEILDTEEYFEDSLQTLGIKNQIFLGLTKINVDEKTYPAVYRLNNNENDIVFYGEKHYSNSDDGDTAADNTIDGKKLLMSSKDIKDIDRGIFDEACEFDNIKTNKLVEWIESVLRETNNRYDDDIYIFCTDDYNNIISEIRNKNSLGTIESVYSFESLDVNLECYELVKYQEHRKFYNRPQIKIHEKFIDNKKQGLFSENCTTFYSVGQRSDSMQSPVTVTKLTEPTKPLNKQRIVEFIVVGEDNPDRLVDIGRMAHDLRKMNLTFKFHTKLPLPLFIIKKHQKYLNVLGTSYKNVKKKL